MQVIGSVIIVDGVVIFSAIHVILAPLPPRVAVRRPNMVVAGAAPNDVVAAVRVDRVIAAEGNDGFAPE